MRRLGVVLENVDSEPEEVLDDVGELFWREVVEGAEEGGGLLLVEGVDGVDCVWCDDARHVGELADDAVGCPKKTACSTGVEAGGELVG